MAKSFGDAFTIDLATRVIRCLTCNVPGAAFLRVMHLPTGDYILIGPERFKDIRTSRGEDNELWFLSRRPGSRPVRFGQKMSEGAAISKKRLRMAWSETSRQFPELPKGYSRLVVADVEPDAPEARQSQSRLREQDRRVHHRGAGFLRRRHEADVLLLPAEGHGQRDGHRPRHRQGDRLFEGPRHVQRTRGHLPGRPVHARSKPTARRKRSAARAASARSISGNCGSTARAKTSPA